MPLGMPDPERYDVGTPFLRMEREGHLAWCTIDRPRSRNAVSAAMYFGLKRAVQLVNALPEPTALLITGLGDVFAPGGELRGKVEDPNPVVEQLGTDELLPFEAVRNSAAPVVLAQTRIFPAAARLGGREGSREERSRLARSICRSHLVCLAALAAFTALQLYLATTGPRAPAGR